jgi:NDP-sugar pyrophosphorylase family protein
MNADILTDLDLKTMYAFHQQHKPLATLAVTKRESSRQFLFDENMKLSGWRNNKTNELRLSVEDSIVENLVPFAFSGIHIIEPKLFTLMPLSGKFSITDTYLQLSSTEIILGYDHSQDIVLDVGKPESLAKAATLFP